MKKPTLAFLGAVLVGFGGLLIANPSVFGGSGGPGCVSNDPVALIQSSATKGVESLDVQFDASRSLGCIDGISSYAWDFGDGTTATGALADHTFAPGQWTTTLTVTDESQLTAQHTVTVTIKPTNAAPAALGDQASAVEGTQLLINVAANDNDVDGDTLTWSLAGQPSHGQVTHQGDGVFAYESSVGFTGSDTFSYQVSDGYGGTATANVAVQVAQRLVLQNDSITTNEDESVNFNVLANDTNAAGNPLTLTFVSQPANGTLTHTVDGAMQFTPNANWSGQTTFYYYAADADRPQYSARGEVVITANPINDLPVAQNDSFSGNEDSVINGNVRANDTDADGQALTALLVTAPLHGTLTLNANGFFSYVPQANYYGTDSFAYQVSDGSATANATANLTINSVNDVPVATADSATLAEDSAITVDVKANDTDADGDALLVNAIVTQPIHGTAVINADGQIVYTPALNYFGSDSLRYRVTDGNGGVTTATLQINVTSVNDGPSALFSHTVGSKRSVAFNAAASSDSDGTIASYTWNFGDGVGQTTTSPTISHTFPRGTFTVLLTVTDNAGATATYQQTVSL